MAIGANGDIKNARKKKDNELHLLLKVDLSYMRLWFKEMRSGKRPSRLVLLGIAPPAKREAKTFLLCL